MKITDIEELKNMARIIRKGIIEQVYSANSGHPGGSLSIADILTVLYFNELNIDEKNPKWEDRDRMILSKGHCSPALYSCLANRGFFDKEELKKFRNINSRLQGHPDMNKVPGVDMTTGSLGQGLSVANGMAIAGKLNKKDYRVYCVLGDGEIEEGQIWEAAMASNKYKLDNLSTAVATETVNGLMSAADKIQLNTTKIKKETKDFERLLKEEDSSTTTKGNKKISLLDSGDLN